MPRPRRHRCVQSAFEYDYFKPCVICRQDADEVVLKIEEMESVRLKDYLGMDQRDAASQMDVSQPTFHRILTEARSKIASALVCGRPIRIHGGTYRMATTSARKFKCYDCQHEWEEAYGTGRPQNCPKCGSTNLHRAEDDRGYVRGGRGRHGR
jgi:predicted DNA-binding protein (UPF0251 family)/DNA-directed RNA polymerase subunit RPC12/RpoP